MYVKCTQQEWSAVEARIGKLFDARHEAAADWMNYGMSQAEFESRCYESVFPATEQALVNQLGKKHFDAHKDLTVIIKHDSHTPRYKLTFTEARFMTSKWHQYYSSDNCIVTDPAIIDIARRRQAALTALANEKSAFIDKIKTMWDQAPSINALIKVWPPITDFLSSDVIERVNRKVERNKATERLALEAGDLSVHLLKAKVAA